MIKDYIHEPGKFRNKITNEEVLALQWCTYNYYAVTQFLEDEDDVCAFTFTPGGPLVIFTLDGSLDVWPMDWIVKSDTGINPCSVKIFDQVCEEIL